VEIRELTEADLGRSFHVEPPVTVDRPAPRRPISEAEANEKVATRYVEFLLAHCVDRPELLRRIEAGLAIRYPGRGELVTLARARLAQISLEHDNRHGRYPAEGWVGRALPLAGTTSPLALPSPDRSFNSRPWRAKRKRVKR